MVSYNIRLNEIKYCNYHFLCYNTFEVEYTINEYFYWGKMKGVVLWQQKVLLILM